MARQAVAGAVRLLLGGALVLVSLALVLGRAGRTGPPILVDRDDGPIRVGVGADGRTSASDQFLDPETGRPVVPALPGGGAIWTSGWAPWAEESGRTQLVGLWKGSALSDAALIRLSEPDGAVLDRVAMADLPAWSATCWFPDRSPRVLLAGFGGVLLRVDFDGPGGGAIRGRSPGGPGPRRGSPGSTTCPGRGIRASAAASSRR